MKMKICALIFTFAILGSVLCEENVVPSDEQVKGMIDELDEEQSLPLFGVLSIDKIDNNSGEVSTSRSEENLTDRIIRYIRSHNVNVDLSEERSDVGGKIKPVIIKKVKKARGKLKKLLLPLLLALKFKTAVILPVAFTILALVSAKALKVGLIALLLAGSQFLKNFFEKKQEKITTAYITANPSSQGVNAEIVTDWNRNGAQGDLAYTGYNSYQTSNYQTLPQNI